MVLRVINLRSEIDELVGLKVLNKGEELLLVCEKDVIFRRSSDLISQQPKAANGLNYSALFLVIT